MNNPENEQEKEHRYPYEPQPGKTHWEGCWKAPGHHNCAVARVYRLQRRLEKAGEALARTDAPVVFDFLDRVEEDAGKEFVQVLGRIRDAALKADYGGQ